MDTTAHKESYVSNTYTAAAWMSTCSCILSILGSFAIFGSYLFIPGIRNSTRKLVTCLTIADFLTALGYLIAASAYLVNPKWHHSVCTTQSVITTYSSLVSFYLTVTIAIHIFSSVVYRNDLTSSWKYLLWANIISWLIPGIIIGVAGRDRVLGGHLNSDTSNATVGTGPWCWLNQENTQYYVFWMFLTGKGWEFACYLITTSLYVLLEFYLYLRHRQRLFTDIHESLRDDDRNYLYVWFVLYVLRLWGSLRSIMYIACKDKDAVCQNVSNAFMYMQAIGDPGQAFCNCILFCFLDATVRSYIFQLCGVKSKQPVSQRERERLIAGGHNNDGHVNDREEPGSEANGCEHSTVQSGMYSSFSTTKKDSPTQRVQKTPESGSKNASVQSRSSSACSEEKFYDSA